jgi:serine/threonine protein kinase, bacterial
MAAFSERADQYSLAATAYHLLTGSQLFPNSNPAAVISRHLNVPPPALADSRPDLAKLDPVLAIGLAKRPEDRFERCSDFACALSEQINSAGAPTQTAPTSPAPVTSAAQGADEVPSQGDSVDKKARNPRLIAAVAAAVVAVILIGGLTWRPWERKAPPSSSESPGPPTSMVQVPPQVSTTAGVQPLPSFSPKAIDQVLLSAEELSGVLGVEVSSNPAAAGGAIALGINSSSYGMSDHSGQVKPPSCVGVAFTGEHDVYATADPAAIKIQTFGNKYGGSASNAAPYWIEETAAVFSSAEQAQSFLKTSLAQWNTCSSTEVQVTLGFENGRTFKLGSVKHEGDVITVSMASWGGLNGLHACQQALGVRANVVVEARTCEEPSVPNFNWQDPVNPAWASPTAAPLASAMLNKVKN